MILRARGLGSPSTTGMSQPLTAGGLFGRSMVPGYCCYDANRPSWLPSWISTDAESQCIRDTNNCASDTASFTYHAPAPAVVPVGTPSVNDKNGTSDALSSGQPTNEELLAQAAQAARDSVQGLTAGGCPQGQIGTYPDCVLPDDPNANTLLIIAAVAGGVLLLGALKGSR